MGDDPQELADHEHRHAPQAGPLREVSEGRHRLGVDTRLRPMRMYEDVGIDRDQDRPSSKS